MSSTHVYKGLSPCSKYVFDTTNWGNVKQRKDTGEELNSKEILGSCALAYLSQDGSEMDCNDYTINIPRLSDKCILNCDLDKILKSITITYKIFIC